MDSKQLWRFREQREHSGMLESGRKSLAYAVMEAAGGRAGRFSASGGFVWLQTEVKQILCIQIWLTKFRDHQVLI